jgi:hypothetical protein
MNRALALLAAALLLAGCAPSAHRAARKLEGRYHLDAPNDGWKRVPPGGADLAWHHAGLGATLYSDSNCGPRFDELAAPLLATELLAGLQAVTTESEAPLSLAGRVGVTRTHAGTLDGVPVRLALAVLNRDACTYDMVLVAPPESFERARRDWERVVQSFTVRRHRAPAGNAK